MTQTGFTGLTNLGNTCYINSCIQILAHTHELNNILDNNNIMNKVKHNIDGTLLREYNDIRNLMWSENCTIAPNKFIDNIRYVAKKKSIEMFTGYHQNDASEFLLFIIDTFHNALARGRIITISGKIETSTDEMAVNCFRMLKQLYKKEYSEIVEMLNGVNVSIISDLKTKKIKNYKCEPFFTITLPIPTHKHSTLTDCFDLYTEGEILKDDNAWFDETQNKKIDIVKKLTFWSFPKILVISLKRFDYNNKKNNTKVIFPLEDLNLTEYSVGYNNEKYVYSLYGVCNHMGSSYGGHYTSYIKNRDNKWYEYDDARITIIPNLNKIVSSYAYCLFYRRIL